MYALSLQMDELPLISKHISKNGENMLPIAIFCNQITIIIALFSILITLRGHCEK